MKYNYKFTSVKNYNTPSAYAYFICLRSEHIHGTPNMRQLAINADKEQIKFFNRTLREVPSRIIN